MGIFSGFGRLVDAILAVAKALHELVNAQREVAPAAERLDALELSRHQFEAEVAGTLLEAKGKLRAASNAEARERQLKKSYEKDADPFPEGGEPEPDASPVLPVDVEAGEAERLPALHLGVATNHKAAALAHKFGRSV